MLASLCSSCLEKFLPSRTDLQDEDEPIATKFNKEKLKDLADEQKVGGVCPKYQGAVGGERWRGWELENGMRRKERIAKVRDAKMLVLILSLCIFPLSLVNRVSYD